MKIWQELRRGKPGRRFQSRYERNQETRCGALRKWSLIALGLVLAGLVFLPLPGPGMLIILAGAMLMAERSRAAARTLDWMELKVRRLVGR